MKATAALGILLLGHGGTGPWNQAVNDVQKSLKPAYSVEVAFGMAETKEIQRAVDRLAAKKASQIVAIPLFVSSYSEVMDQTRFVLGLSAKPSADFMNAPHSHRHGGEHGMAAAQKANIPVPVVMTSALDDHPLVAAILLDRAREMSKEPGKEFVIIVGHGPLKDAENARWLSVMGRLADQVKKKGGFSDVRAATLRDDAAPPVRDQADKILRDMVGELSRKGRVIVVPLLLAQGGIERHIRKSLDGMFYEWTGKTLLPDPRINEWVKLKINEGADLLKARQPRQGAAHGN